MSKNIRFFFIVGLEGGKKESSGGRDGRKGRPDISRSRSAHTSPTRQGKPVASLATVGEVSGRERGGWGGRERDRNGGCGVYVHVCIERVLFCLCTL